MPDTGSRKDRTAFSRSEIQLLILLVVFGEVLGIGAAVLTHKCAPWLSTIFATAATTLLFGALLGGVITQLLAELDRRRVRRAATLDFIVNVLADLKAVHDQVDRGRMLIKANKSAKTYGEEMRGFMEARVKLLSVQRALQTDERERKIPDVLENVNSMEEYLRSLLAEFEDNYKTVSLEQRIFEANLERAVKPPPGQQPTSEVSALPQNHPWEKIKDLEQLKDFLKPLPPKSGSKEEPTIYGKKFLEPLDNASRKLRYALADQLSSA